MSEAYLCAGCGFESLLPLAQARCSECVGRHLSTLVGAPVRVFRRDPCGALVLTGATKPLAEICGFKASGRVYFTGMKARMLLAMSRAA